MVQMVKYLPSMQEAWFNLLVRKIPWKRDWLPTPVFLIGGFPGQRSLVGYSLWGHKNSDTTEMTEHTHNQEAKSISPSFESALVL